MKYKIVPNDIVKNLIEFLDEIQFEASAGCEPGDMQRINFCNYLIGELMNSLDGYIKEESDMPSINKKSKRWKKIDKLKKDFKQDFPEDMTEKDFKKLIQNFESFAKAWDKEYTKSNLKDTAKETTMEEWEQELKLDRELKPQENFEL